MPRRWPRARFGATTGLPVMPMGDAPELGDVPADPAAPVEEGPEVPHVPSLPFWTHTSRRFERTESARSALSACVPGCVNVMEAWPCASVLCPATLAPAMGAPLAP